MDIPDIGLDAAIEEIELELANMQSFLRYLRGDTTRVDSLHLSSIATYGWRIAKHASYIYEEMFEASGLTNEEWEDWKKRGSSPFKQSQL